LLIADLTGRASCSNQAEREHARDNAATLIKVLVEQTLSPWQVIELGGGHVFACAPSESFQAAQTLVEILEGMYVSFRRALERTARTTSCTCSACRNLSNLDLNFFVHFGSHAWKSQAGHIRATGKDVNLLHQLATDSVGDAKGPRSYAAYTQAVTEALPFGEMLAAMQVHKRAWPEVGEVLLYLQDLHAVWDRKCGEFRVSVQPEQALISMAFDFPLPPALLWEYITNPEQRKLLLGSDWQRLEQPMRGRTGPGAVFYCAQGDRMLTQSVLDWQPFEQYTTNDSHRMPFVNANRTYRIDPTPGGSRLQVICGKAQGPLALRWIGNLMVRSTMMRSMPHRARALLDLITSDLAAGRARFRPPNEFPTDVVRVSTEEDVDRHSAS
jgi:hypothetical protein